MILSSTQKRSLIITAVLMVTTLATAGYLQQVGTEPVAPSAPKSKPSADEINPSPGPDSLCLKTWTITSGPTTFTPHPSSTPVPAASEPPTTSPRPSIQIPTAIPTVMEDDFSQTNIADQIITPMLAGLGFLGLALLLLILI